MHSFPGPANFVGLILLGGVLLWTAQLVYGRRSALSGDGLLLFMTFTAWVMIVVGLLGALVAMPVAGVIPTMIVLVILAMLAVRFHDCERRSLLWVLSTSAERGLPLAPAARAYAAERMDEQGRRARRLAELLEASTPLPDALRRSKHRLTSDANLAISAGLKMDDMGQLLRDAAHEGGRLTRIWQSLFEKTLYLLLVAFTMSGVILYLWMSIVPTYVEIFEDYDVPLPPITNAVTAATGAIATFAWLAVLFHAAAFVVLGVAVFYYIGWLRWEPPIVNRLTRPVDSANLMRVLSHATLRDTSILGTIAMLSQCHPKGHIRSRLLKALRRMHEGTDWYESLRSVGLFTASDATVLRAAQRLGNLPWALREMADRSLRRLSFRVSAMQQIAFPLLIGLLAIPVVVTCIACIQPLVHLIEMMSHV